ncbi:MAG: hypothetical protein ACMG6S_30185, partial [Byssovorax sp.]
MNLHALSRSPRAGKLHAFAMLALFAVGCTQPVPGELQVNVGQDSSGEGGAGGSDESTTGAGGDTGSGGASTTSTSSGGVPQPATFTVSLDTSTPGVDLDDAV